MPETERASDALQPELAHQFETREQQHEAATIGMWVFLATEVMFFGGIITAFVIYRALYPDAFGMGSHHLDVVSGTLMTLILLGSSLTMAFAVHGAGLGAGRFTAAMLLATIVLGTAFVGLKFNEYHHMWEENLFPFVSGRFLWPGSEAPHVRLFLWFYFVMTGIHALHMLIGIGLMAVLIVGIRRKWVNRNTVEISGLYWHFVDIVWIFLFPLIYLFHRHA